MRWHKGPLQRCDPLTYENAAECSALKASPDTTFGLVHWYALYQSQARYPGTVPCSTGKFWALVKRGTPKCSIRFCTDDVAMPFSIEVFSIMATRSVPPRSSSFPMSLRSTRLYRLLLLRPWNGLQTTDTQHRADFCGCAVKVE